MKRILALIMALAITCSALVFCSADIEMKLDVRLDYDDQGNVNMVFSIPENANLGEFNIDVYYYALVMDIDYNSAISFESNLSPEEEALIEWNVDTDRNNRANEDSLYPRCIIDGYVAGKKGLNEGGDLFTLKFKTLSERADATHDFKVNVNYLSTTNGKKFNNAKVPTSINYVLFNSLIADYTTTYAIYNPVLELETVDDQTKKAAIFDTYTEITSGWVTPQQLDLLGNYMFENGSNAKNGGVMFAQTFVPAQDYIRGVRIYCNLDNQLVRGNPYLTIQFRKNYYDNNGTTEDYTRFSNNFWTDPLSIGWYDIDIVNKLGGTMPILDSEQIYYLSYAWMNTDNCRNGYPWRSNTTKYSSYPLYISGSNSHNSANYTKYTNYVMPFQITYDWEVINFINAALYSIPSTVDVDSESIVSDVRKQYNSIDYDAQRSKISNTGAPAKLTNAEASINAAKQKITDFKNAVTSIGSGGIAISEGTAITNAINAYNALSAAQKAYSGVSTSKSTLDGYKNTHTSLVNGYTAVINEINKLPNPVLWNNRSVVSTARSNYDKLNADQKNYVSNYSTLQAREKYVADLTTIRQNFIDAVTAIGTVDYSTAMHTKIQKAKDAYATVASFTGDKGYIDSVNDYKATLDAADARYLEIEADIVNVQNLVDKCYNSNGTVTVDKLDEIQAARTAYNNLTSGGKTWLTNNGFKARLETAESKYDDAVVANVKSLIDAIGEVTYTEASAKKIQEANAAKDKLTSTQLTKLGNVYLTKLNEANLKYADLKAAQPVIDAINGIGTVTLAKESTVNSVRSQYNALTDKQKSYVSNYSTLTSAESTISKLKGYQQDFIDKVNAIGTVVLTNDCHSKLQAARNAYVTIHNTGDTTLINNVKSYLTILEGKEDEIRALEAEVNEVKALIDKVGTLDKVVYTEECGLNIQAANNAKDALDDYQKAWLGNVYLTKLNEANLKYADLVAAHKVIDEINALPSTIYWNNRSVVSTARANYDKLTDKQKTYVTNLSVLEAKEKYIADLTTIRQNFIDAVEAIPKPFDNPDKFDYYPTVKSKIDAATSAYNTVNQYADTGFKDSVKDYKSTLDSAVAKWAELEYEIDQFKQLVDNCFPVDLDKDDEINAAKTVHLQLTDGQLAALETMKDASGEYYLDKYYRAHKEYEDAWAKVDNVSNLIKSIFEGNKGNPLSYKVQKRDDAQIAYDKLTEPQKAGLATKSYNFSDLQRANREIAVDEIVDGLVQEAGLDGRKLNHSDTAIREYFEYTKTAINAHNVTFPARPYGYDYITEDIFDVIENQIKIIEGFDNCTKAWVKEGRHLDPNTIKQGSYDPSLKNTAITDDSQTSIYFEVTPRITKPTSSDSATTILGFEDTNYNNVYGSHSTNVAFETGEKHSSEVGGIQSLKMTMTDPQKVVEISPGVTANVGGQVVYTFPTAKDLSSYKSFKFNFLTPVDLQGDGGILRVNFVTDDSLVDGFNFNVVIDYAYTGWNTYVINNKDNPDDVISGADWKKIKRITFTWFNYNQIYPKDANGTCFFLLDNLCGTSITRVNDTVTLGAGLSVGVYIDGGVPQNTKFILKNIKSGKLYGYEALSDGKSSIYLNDFVSLETKKKYDDGYINATSLSGELDGLSFIMIVDFSNTISYGSEKYKKIALDIYDTWEFQDYGGGFSPTVQQQMESTVYSMDRTNITTKSRRSLTATTPTLSASSITKNGKITVSGSYSNGDATSNATDNFNVNKNINVMVQLKNTSTGKYIPVDSIAISEVSGITNGGKGGNSFYFKGDSSSTKHTKNFSFTLDFKNCYGIEAGTYEIVITTSRVANNNTSLGYYYGEIDAGSVVVKNSFTVTTDPQLGLKVAFNSLDGNTTNKFIDRSKNTNLKVDISYQNTLYASNKVDSTLTIGIQQKNSNGTYSNLSTNTYISGTTSRTLPQNNGKYDNETITIIGTKFAANSTYRLVFTMQNGNTKIIRYLNLLTV